LLCAVCPAPLTCKCSLLLTPCVITAPQIALRCMKRKDEYSRAKRQQVKLGDDGLGMGLNTPPDFKYIS